ncbi:MAG: sigma-70 family RNA polymerase sigma factor [Actinobacteria bacterium]|nr:sigma-70 family RNA polymerase sigma factor [Actinomycetota bacterium]
MPDERPNAAQVYRSLAAPVLGYLRAQRVAEPDDVLGDVFLHVARDLARFRGDEAALRRWVFSIAHNRAMDDHRRRGRQPARAESGQLGVGQEPPAPAPADPVDPALVEALAALSPDQREVVVLRFVADLPLEAVAKVTGRKVGAVKALQHRALDNLRSALGSPG